MGDEPLVYPKSLSWFRRFLRVNPDYWPVFDHTNPRAAEPAFRGSGLLDVEDVREKISAVSDPKELDTDLVNEFGDATLRASRLYSFERVPQLWEDAHSVMESCSASAEESTRRSCVKWAAVFATLLADTKPVRERVALLPTVALKAAAAAAAAPCDPDAQILAASVSYKIANLSWLERAVVDACGIQLPSVSAVDVWYHAETAAALRGGWVKGAYLRTLGRAGAPEAAPAPSEERRKRWVQSSAGACIYVWPITELDLLWQSDVRKVAGMRPAPVNERVISKPQSVFGDDNYVTMNAVVVAAKRAVSHTMGEHSQPPCLTADPPE